VIKEPRFIRDTELKVIKESKESKGLSEIQELKVAKESGRESKVY
jgi:hypothetical protein